MRCKNCGWPNKPGATNCSKCNSPLSEMNQPSPAPAPGLAPPMAEPRQFVPDQHPSVPKSESLGGAPLGGTVYENEAFPDAAPARPSAPAPSPVAEGTILTGVNAPSPAPATAAESPASCPKCGYPLRPGTDKCPNCRFQIRNAAPAPISVAPATEATRPVEPETPDFKRQATIGVQEAFRKPAEAFSGTVNPLVQRIIPEFSLTLQPRDGEHIEKPVLEFEGESTSLNRDNVDPGNNSITSKEQARIVFENGKWFVEDKSAFKTTFVQAGRKTEIKNGDTILMGSRMVVFNCEADE